MKSKNGCPFCGEKVIAVIESNPPNKSHPTLSKSLLFQTKYGHHKPIFYAHLKKVFVSLNNLNYPFKSVFFNFNHGHHACHVYSQKRERFLPGRK